MQVACVLCIACLLPVSKIWRIAPFSPLFFGPVAFWIFGPLENEKKRRLLQRLIDSFVKLWTCLHYHPCRTSHVWPMHRKSLIHSSWEYKWKRNWPGPKLSDRKKKVVSWKIRQVAKTAAPQHCWLWLSSRNDTVCQFVLIGMPRRLCLVKAILWTRFRSSLSPAGGKLI